MLENIDPPQPGALFHIRPLQTRFTRFRSRDIITHLVHWDLRYGQGEGLQFLHFCGMLRNAAQSRTFRLQIEIEEHGDYQEQKHLSCWGSHLR